MTHYYKPRQKENINHKDAFIIGFVSSSSCNTGLISFRHYYRTGLLLGNKKANLAQFSFLMVIPPILGEAMLDILKFSQGVDVTVLSLMLL